MGIPDMIVFAFALNIDIFVFSFFLGTSIQRGKGLLLISIILAFFSCLIPLLGFLLGNYTSSILGSISSKIGAVVLILIGIQLIKKARTKYFMSPVLSLLILISKLGS